MQPILVIRQSCRCHQVGAEWAQPGVGCTKRICDGRGLYDLFRLSEPVADLYGADGEGSGFRGHGLETREYITRRGARKIYNLRT